MEVLFYAKEQKAGISGIYQGRWRNAVSVCAIFTEGHDLVDAIEMARDAIGMAGKAYEEDRKELPEPSDYEEAIKKAELIKSDFDYTRGYLTLVDVDFQLFDRA